MNIKTNEGLIPSGTNDHVGQVALPLNENQFKDFIVSLLGKPQTITKRFTGTFEITKENIISIFEILNQRVNQQNDAQLIQFRATIYYNDDSTVTLSGFDHLTHYNESLPIVSKAVHLTWQYLIKFRDKSTFEKQEINLSFITSMEGRISLDEDFEVYAHESQVYVRIQHTARTWGADIEGILSRHLKTIVKEDSKFFNFIRYNPDRVQNGISGILAIITLIFSIFYTQRKLPSSANTPIFWIHHYGSLVFLILTIYALIKGTLIILDIFEVYSKPSFILLTSESLTDKKNKLKSFKKQWRRYVFTIMGSLILGVVANYIYAFLTQ